MIPVWNGWRKSTQLLKNPHRDNAKDCSRIIDREHNQIEIDSRIELKLLRNPFRFRDGWHTLWPLWPLLHESTPQMLSIAEPRLLPWSRRTAYHWREEPWIVREPKRTRS